MQKRSGVRGLLKREGYYLDTTPEALDRRLLNAVGPDRESDLQLAWMANQCGDAKRLYQVPRTPREALLLFSHDAERCVGA
jgi:hypothetical protein